jgi:hypothetical protein
MTCQLLPIISNTAGDWLCVRIDQHNVASEVVQWYHGAGDWIPWGSNLAEAIVFDAVIDRLPGPSRRHAIPAEDPRGGGNQEEQSNHAALRWALEHVPSSLGGVLDASLTDTDIASLLLDAGVAEIAVRCELVLSNLMSSTRQSLEPLLRDDPQVTRDDLAEWSFDVDRIPQHKRGVLERQYGAPFAGMQDWDAASEDALPVTQLAPELAWAWDIVGYAAERRGDVETAKQAYRRAAGCSVFTDQSIRLEMHWTAARAAKFSVARLLSLCPEEVEASPYLSLLCESDIKQRRRRTMAYWNQQASRLDEAGDHLAAYRCLVAAGWDVGAEPIDVYAALLDRIADAADRSNQHARAEIARTHGRCLRDRYV